MDDTICNCNHGIGKLGMIDVDGVSTCRSCGKVTEKIDEEPISRQMTSTLDSLPGYRVTAVHGIVSTMTNLQSTGVEGGLLGLRRAAAAAGGNALIGVLVSIGVGTPAMLRDVPGSMLRAVAIGTSVTVEKSSDSA